MGGVFGVMTSTDFDSDLLFWVENCLSVSVRLLRSRGELRNDDSLNTNANGHGSWVGDDIVL